VKKLIAFGSAQRVRLHDCTGPLGQSALLLGNALVAFMSKMLTSG